MLLLALNALLLPTVQSVRHAVLVHEDIAAGFLRDVFTCIVGAHATLPGFKARLQLSSGRPRHRDRVMMAVALGGPGGSWAWERTNHWLAIYLAPVTADHHFRF